MLRTQILAKLVLKYPGLSKEFLGQLATRLAKTVTVEDQIEGKLTELDTLPISIEDQAAMFQSEGDRRVSAAKTEWEKKNPPKKPKSSKTDDDEDDDDFVEPQPGKAKKDDSEIGKLTKLVTTLAGTVNTLVAEKTQTTMKQKAAEKLKDVPDIVWNKRALPEKEEDLDAFVAEVTNEWTVFKQDKKNEGLLGNPVPGGPGAAGAGVVTGKEEADIEAWAVKEKAAAEKKT